MITKDITIGELKATVREMVPVMVSELMADRRSQEPEIRKDYHGVQFVLRYDERLPPDSEVPIIGLECHLHPGDHLAFGSFLISWDALNKPITEVIQALGDGLIEGFLAFFYVTWRGVTIHNKKVYTTATIGFKSDAGSIEYDTHDGTGLTWHSFPVNENTLVYATEPNPYTEILIKDLKGKTLDHLLGLTEEKEEDIEK